MDDLKYIASRISEIRNEFRTGDKIDFNIDSDIDKKVQTLRKIPESERTLGQVWINDVYSELDQFVIYFDVFIKSLRFNREMSDVIDYWYGSDFEVRYHVIEFLSEYSKLIDIGSEPKCNSIKDSFQRMCKITESYTTTMERLIFIKSINEELCEIIKFLNPSVLKNNHYLSHAAFILPAYKSIFINLVDEVDFFKNEVVNIVDEKEIKHQSELIVLKSNRDQDYGYIKEQEFYFPRIMAMKRKKARELRELNRKKNSKPIKPIDINKSDSGDSDDEDNSE